MKNIFTSLLLVLVSLLAVSHVAFAQSQPAELVFSATVPPPIERFNPLLTVKTLGKSTVAPVRRGQDLGGGNYLVSLMFKGALRAGKGTYFYADVTGPWKVATFIVDTQGKVQAKQVVALKEDSFLVAVSLASSSPNKAQLFIGNNGERSGTASLERMLIDFKDSAESTGILKGAFHVTAIESDLVAKNQYFGISYNEKLLAADGRVLASSPAKSQSATLVSVSGRTSQVKAYELPYLKKLNAALLGLKMLDSNRIGVVARYRDLGMSAHPHRLELGVRNLQSGQFQKTTYSPTNPRVSPSLVRLETNGGLVRAYVVDKGGSLAALPGDKKWEPGELVKMENNGFILAVPTTFLRDIKGITASLRELATKYGIDAVAMQTAGAFTTAEFLERLRQYAQTAPSRTEIITSFLRKCGVGLLGDPRCSIVGDGFPCQSSEDCGAQKWCGLSEVGQTVCGLGDGGTVCNNVADCDKPGELRTCSIFTGRCSVFGSGDTQCSIDTDCRPIAKGCQNVQESDFSMPVMKCIEGGTGKDCYSDAECSPAPLRRCVYPANSIFPTCTPSSSGGNYCDTDEDCLADVFKQPDLPYEEGRYASLYNCAPVRVKVEFIPNPDGGYPGEITWFSHNADAGSFSGPLLQAIGIGDGSSILNQLGLTKENGIRLGFARDLSNPDWVWEIHHLCIEFTF